MFDTKVVTSYTTGTIIEMDANDALHFLMGLSITVINTIRDTIKEENEFGGLTTKSSDHDTMHLIEHYKSGIPGAVYSCILNTNADILLKFVQDVVLNETTSGLYLFYKSGDNNGEATYYLIVRALEEVHQYCMKYGHDDYKRNKDKWFNRYNTRFLDLMNK